MARAEQRVATAGGLRPAPLLSVRSVCRWLAKGRGWVMDMVHVSAVTGGDGPWRVVKVGRDWRIEQASVEAWLASQREQNRAQPRNDRSLAS